MSERALRDELEALSARVLAARRERDAYSHDAEVQAALRAAQAAAPELEARLAKAKAAHAEVSRTHRLLRASVEQLRETLAAARAEIATYENPGDPLADERRGRSGW